MFLLLECENIQLFTKCHFSLKKYFCSQGLGGIMLG